MYVDAELFLGIAQAITVTANTTSYVDTLAAGDSYKEGMYCQFLINTSFTTNGATIAFSLQTAPTNAFSTGLVTLASSAAINVSALTAGIVAFQFKIPPGALEFLQGTYTVASGPAAAGKVDCRLLMDTNLRIG